MKTCVILALALAAPLGAQATSQQRIPVKKQRPVHVDTVVVRQVDTVMVVRNDTVYVVAPPPMSLAAFDTTVKGDSTCGRGWLPIPIPIPIPIPYSHHEPTPETPSTPTIPTLPSSTTPEPATVWLVGAGLSALGLVRRRARQRRKSENDASKTQGASSPS